MTIKKAIAIGGLSILAFTLTLFGINHNLFKSKKPQESNAEDYIGFSRLIDNDNPYNTPIYNYSIRTKPFAIYSNPNANDEYIFYYDATIIKETEIYNTQNPNATDRYKTTISIDFWFIGFSYNNTYEETGSMEEIYYEYYTGFPATQQQNEKFEFKQTGFTIEENYYVTSYVTIYTIMQNVNYTYNAECTTGDPVENPYNNITNNTTIEIETIKPFETLNTFNNVANNNYTNGYTNGYEAGLTANQQEIYNQGKTDGYAEGYNDSEAFNHPIALQPLMLNILSMPFTFISKAFDVTLWPNTPYEFNIANFIKALIAIAAIIFIIKLFTSGFSVMGNFTGKINSNIRSNKPNKAKPTKTNTPKKE